MHLTSDSLYIDIRCLYIFLDLYIHMYFLLFVTVTWTICTLRKIKAWTFENAKEETVFLLFFSSFQKELKTQSDISARMKCPLTKIPGKKSLSPSTVYTLRIVSFCVSQNKNPLCPWLTPVPHVPPIRWHYVISDKAAATKGRIKYSLRATHWSVISCIHFAAVTTSIFQLPLLSCTAVLLGCRLSQM